MTTGVVLHRLAVAVEPIDARSGARIDQGLRVERELPRGPRQFERNGSGRFKLRHAPGVGTSVTVRLYDPRRRYAPRRFVLPLWSLDEVTAADVAARSRLLRPWLLPGGAYPTASGMTGIRGRVFHAGEPQRWPRVVAVDPDNDNRVIGRAHGDERGEFLLLFGTGALPLAEWSTFGVQLFLRARDPAEPAIDHSKDELADLPVKPVNRSSKAATPTELDNPLLRGETIPAGYIASTTRPRPTETLTVGQLFIASEPYE